MMLINRCWPCFVMIVMAITLFVYSTLRRVPRHNYRIGVPEASDYQEILNTDSMLLLW